VATTGVNRWLAGGILLYTKGNLIISTLQRATRICSCSRLEGEEKKVMKGVQKKKGK
jgi:hypothetical protein